jgi:hypothetical protein
VSSAPLDRSTPAAPRPWVYLACNAAALCALALACAPLLWRTAFARPRFSDGVQAASPRAALRLNNWGGRAGFDGPPQTVPATRRVFIGVSGMPYSAFAVFLGRPYNPGLAFPPHGTLNLDLRQPVHLLALGETDARGEAELAATVPHELAPGWTFAVQAVVAGPSPAGPSLALSNPEAAVVEQQ